MTRVEQFAHIASARIEILRWAGDRSIPLHRVEFVVPFVDSDLGLSAWFFYRTDEQLRRADALRWSEGLRAAFIDILRTAGYAPARLTEVLFVFDSHETVVRDYAGSYFYRLR